MSRWTADRAPSGSAMGASIAGPVPNHTGCGTPDMDQIESPFYARRQLCRSERRLAERITWRMWRRKKLYTAGGRRPTTRLTRDLHVDFELFLTDRLSVGLGFRFLSCEGTQRITMTRTATHHCRFRIRGRAVFWNLDKPGSHLDSRRGKFHGVVEVSPRRGGGLSYYTLALRPTPPGQFWGWRGRFLLTSHQRPFPKRPHNVFTFRRGRRRANDPEELSVSPDP